MIKYILGISLLAGLVISACNKTSFIGPEILGGDFVDVGYTDTMSLWVKNIKADSVRTFPGGSQIFLIGHVDDPVFGETSTEAYMQVSKIFDIPDLRETKLDSVVLSISINRDAFWGDTLADHEVHVYELGESLETMDSIYSNQRFEAGMQLGSKIFNPIESDSASFIFEGDTFYQRNILRIPLDLSFGEKLFNDTLAMDNDTLLHMLTNGLIIRSEPQNSSVFGMNNGIYLDDFTNKLIFYYTKSDTLRRTHTLTIGARKAQYIVHDRQGTTVEEFLDSGMNGDSLLFLGGMVNTNLEVEIPYLEILEDKLINFAEIEFYTTSLPGQLPYPLVSQLYLYNRLESGGVKFTEDLETSINATAPYFYDGTLTEETGSDGGTFHKYNINFTNELKRRIREKDTNTKMLLTPYFTQGRAQRVVLCGPGHSTYPAKIKITYTNQ